MSSKDFDGGVIGKIRGKFTVNERKSDHLFYDISYNGKKILRTHRSHGSSGKDIPDVILGKIKRQLRLDNIQQLHDLKDCPMSASDYQTLLKGKKVI